MRLRIIRHQARTLSTTLTGVRARFRPTRLLRHIFQRNIRRIRAISVSRRRFILRNRVFLRMTMTTRNIRQMQGRHFFFNGACQLRTITKRLRHRQCAISTVSQLTNTIRQSRFSTLRVTRRTRMRRLTSMTLTNRIRTRTTRIRLTGITINTRLRTRTRRQAVTLRQVVRHNRVRQRSFNQMTHTGTTARIVSQRTFRQHITLSRRHEAQAFRQVRLRGTRHQRQPRMIKPRRVRRQVTRFQRLIVRLLARTPNRRHGTLRRPLRIQVPPNLARREHRHQTALNRSAAWLTGYNRFTLMMIIGKRKLPT